MPGAAVVAASYLVGAVPVTNLAARALRGVDLRQVGNGTVSGTGLYEVAGFGPLAFAGCVELAKGAAGPLLAGPERPHLASLAAGAALAGHNWSPFLSFRGGRGISLAMGALSVVAPEGLAILGAGVGLGRLAGETGFGCFVAVSSLPALLYRTRGWKGLALGACLAGPVLTKRVLGNAPVPPGRGPRTYVNRLLFDNDRRGQQSQ